MTTVAHEQDTTDAILARAAARAKEQGVGYAGLVTPTEAWELMRADAATLVDVRTRFEAEYVGRVPNTPLVEWKQMGNATPNPRFLDEVDALPDQRGRLLFLCRSGVRSHAAAVAAKGAGHAGAFNILEGFEGDLDEHGHRGTRGGWRMAGLPWIQG